MVKMNIGVIVLSLLIATCCAEAGHTPGNVNREYPLLSFTGKVLAVNYREQAGVPLIHFGVMGEKGAYRYFIIVGKRTVIDVNGKIIFPIDLKDRRVCVRYVMLGKRPKVLDIEILD